MRVKILRTFFLLLLCFVDFVLNIILYLFSVLGGGVVQNCTLIDSLHVFSKVLTAMKSIFFLLFFTLDPFRSSVLVVVVLTNVLAELWCFS